MLEFVRSGVSHGVVRATAGSGKTTTLVQVATALPDDLRVCFLAFARDAANELRARLPQHVEARTVHSLAMRTLSTYLWKAGVKLQAPDDGKYCALVRTVMAELAFGYVLPKEAFDIAGAYLLELVKFACYNLTQTKNESEVRALSVRYTLTPPEDAELEVEMHQRLSMVLRQGHDQTIKYGRIDYTDMLYLP